jgi:hypothetical protein
MRLCFSGGTGCVEIVQVDTKTWNWRTLWTMNMFDALKVSGVRNTIEREMLKQVKTKCGDECYIHAEFKVWEYTEALARFVVSTNDIEKAFELLDDAVQRGLRRGHVWTAGRAGWPYGWADDRHKKWLETGLEMIAKERRAIDQKRLAKRMQLIEQGSAVGKGEIGP